MPSGILRVLSTNDFIGSFFPQRTSYGWLPGGAALQHTAEQLRAEHPASLWIDTGDLAQACALDPLSDGTFGFLALRELSIDVATVGNHDLDWGLGHLHRWSRELCFPFLAANADLGFPGATVLRTGDWRVGVIGVTYPNLTVLHPERPVAPDPAAIVRRLAADLRREECDAVVLALHDGVRGRELRGTPDTDTADVARFCAAVAGHVDVVLGGHTLGHWTSELGGVPFLQPWPMGAQLGVADISPSREVAPSAVDVTEPRSWVGVGAGSHAALSEEIVGHLERPLACSPTDVSLAQTIADGVLLADPTIDVTAIARSSLWTQPALDGVGAYLPAGDVSMAQVLRTTPLTGSRTGWGGQLLVADLDRDEAERALAAITRSPDSSGTVANVAVTAGDPSGTRVRLAIPPFYRPICEPELEAVPMWGVARVTWRDGLLRTLRGEELDRSAEALTGRRP